MIDLGPEGGDKGGTLLYQGPVKDCQQKGNASITAKYLSS
jgi:excinuclease UvrABC ATPase subunit